MDIKNCKLRKVISCNRNEDIVSIAKKLRDNRERQIIVTENEKPIGIISTTDINNKIVAENKDPKKIKAHEIMTSKILVKDINEKTTETYIQMVKENIFSCPVTKDGKLIGILDLKELMNHIVKLKPKK